MEYEGIRYVSIWVEVPGDNWGSWGTYLGVVRVVQVSRAGHRAGPLVTRVGWKWALWKCVTENEWSLINHHLHDHHNHNHLPDGYVGLVVDPNPDEADPRVFRNRARRLLNQTCIFVGFSWNVFFFLFLKDFTWTLASLSFVLDIVGLIWVQFTWH